MIWEKHLMYHCHLTSEEKEFYITPEDNEAINRKRTEQQGLPSEDKLISNGKIKYPATLKLWECMICHKESTKYNRRQMINHVNTAHIASSSSLRTSTKRGMRVEKEDDIVLKMGNCYGRIKTVYELSSDNET